LIAIFFIGYGNYFQGYVVMAGFYKFKTVSIENFFV